MYVFAGLVSAPVWLPVAWFTSFDPATNQWTKKKPMLCRASSGPNGIQREDLCLRRIYSRQDRKPGRLDPINNAFEYDPVNDSWKALAPMPTKRVQRWPPR